MSLKLSFYFLVIVIDTQLAWILTCQSYYSEIEIDFIYLSRHTFTIKKILISLTTCYLHIVYIRKWVFCFWYFLIYGNNYLWNGEMRGMMMFMRGELASWCLRMVPTMYILSICCDLIFQSISKKTLQVTFYIWKIKSCVLY